MSDEQTGVIKRDHKDRNKEEKLSSILRVLQVHPEGVFAKIVANETESPKVSYETVRKYLRELVGTGEAYQESGTKLYKSVTNNAYGAAGLPKFQNLRLMVRCPSNVILEHDEVVDVSDTIKLRVTFGETHNRVTASVSAEPPMSLRELIMCMRLFRYTIKDKIGLDVLEDTVEISTVEIVTDFEKIRLDGVKSVTITSIFGGVEKWYNKEDRVRREVVVRKTTLPALVALFRGGVKDFNNTQILMELKEGLKDNTEAQKYTNRSMQDLGNRMRLLEEKMGHIVVEEDTVFVKKRFVRMSSVIKSD